MRRVLLLLTLLALAAAPETFGAQDIHINPVPPGVKPQWTRVPGAPQVSWAPNLPTDVFRYGGKYYFGLLTLLSKYCNYFECQRF
jgi:hypothetical protein